MFSICWTDIGYQVKFVAMILVGTCSIGGIVLWEYYVRGAEGVMTRSRWCLGDFAHVATFV